MEYLNSIHLRGVVGRISTVKVQDNECVRISLATDRAYKDRDGNAVIEITWHNITGWKHTLKGCDPEDIQNGDILEIEGRVHNVRYAAEDGSDRVFNEVIANKIAIINRENK